MARPSLRPAFQPFEMFSPVEVPAQSAGKPAVISMTSTTLAAALIAGGRSARMGRDKCLLPCGRGFLWEHQMETLRRLRPDELFISCRRDQSYFDDPAAPRITDRWADCGPLAGIASVLQTMRSTHLLALGVDLPRMKPVVLKELLKAIRPETGAVFRNGEIWEPLAAVYPAGLSAMAEESLARGNFSLQHFIRRAVEAGALLPIPLPAPWIGCFENWNHPEELPRAK